MNFQKIIFYIHPLDLAPLKIHKSGGDQISLPWDLFDFLIILKRLNLSFIGQIPQQFSTFLCQLLRKMMLLSHYLKRLAHQILLYLLHILIILSGRGDQVEKRSKKFLADGLDGVKGIVKVVNDCFYLHTLAGSKALPS